MDFFDQRRPKKKLPNKSFFGGLDFWLIDRSIFFSVWILNEKKTRKHTACDCDHHHHHLIFLFLNFFRETTTIMMIIIFRLSKLSSVQKWKESEIQIFRLIEGKLDSFHIANIFSLVIVYNKLNDDDDKIITQNLFFRICKIFLITNIVSNSVQVWLDSE